MSDHQPELFDFEPQRTTRRRRTAPLLPPLPIDQAPCIVCGALEAYVTKEAATFKRSDKGIVALMVSVYWHCDGCGGNSLTLREQESPWVLHVALCRIPF